MSEYIEDTLYAFFGSNEASQIGIRAGATFYH